MMMAAVGLGDTAGVCTRSVSAGEATGRQIGCYRANGVAQPKKRSSGQD